MLPASTVSPPSDKSLLLSCLTLLKNSAYSLASYAIFLLQPPNAPESSIMIQRNASSENIGMVSGKTDDKIAVAVAGPIPFNFVNALIIVDTCPEALLSSAWSPCGVTCSGGDMEKASSTVAWRSLTEFDVTKGKIVGRNFPRFLMTVSNAILLYFRGMMHICGRTISTVRFL
ncbi:hypothetical protein ABW21_db0202002 [Orbilia brochopaga]|nr:hypothetical protein ABW21_db0202002 [Drechslerella brochopaga]